MALLTSQPTGQHPGQNSHPVLAKRMRVVRWRDLRLWVGLAIIVGAMFAGAFMLSRGEQTTTVWRATKDLSIGSIPLATPVTVSLGAVQGQYLPSSEPLTGKLRWPVAAGDLIPIGALGYSSLLNARLVTLPVDPLHAPVGLTTGDVVDIWSTPAAVAGGSSALPSLVLPGVTVAQAAVDAVGIGGQIAVVVEVPAAAADELVTAARAGSIDLVSVPITSQQTP